MRLPRNAQLPRVPFLLRLCPPIVSPLAHPFRSKLVHVRMFWDRRDFAESSLFGLTCARACRVRFALEGSNEPLYSPGDCSMDAVSRPVHIACSVNLGTWTSGMPCRKGAVPVLFGIAGPYRGHSAHRFLRPM